MALNISAWSIRHPLPSVVFSIILLLLGYFSFTKLAVTRLPSADIPVISVAVSQFGAAPAELEAQVTKTIEDGVSGVEGVRHISSSITDGLSVTTIQFALETNTDRALNDVKDAVTRVRANLPQNVTEPLIQRVDVIGLPIVTYAAISPGKTPEQLSYFVDDVVKRALQGVRNVAQVERIGGVEREILVSLDPDRLQAAGLTAVNVGQSLRGTNVDLAGGRAEIGKNDQAIRTLAGAKTLNDLAGTMIPLFGGGEEFGSTISAPSPTPSPTAAPSPASTASRWWRSASSAPRAPATWLSPPPYRSESTRSRLPIQMSTSS